MLFQAKATKNIYIWNLIILPFITASQKPRKLRISVRYIVSRRCIQDFFFHSSFCLPIHTRTFNIFYNPTLTIMFTHEYIIPSVYKFFIGP